MSVLLAKIVAASPTCPGLSKAGRIISIGFDGPNRAGKGTQCARLHAWLTAQGVPALIIRGDGSRTGQGDSPGDPLSAWWQAANRWLRTPEASYTDWNLTSYRLARELLVWRDRTLPRQVRAWGQSWGVLLIDRSLLSRTMVLRAMQLPNVAENLYPEAARPKGKGRRLTPSQVCPDVLFNLTAPREILLTRLTPNDPKYAFRKGLIEQTAPWFTDAIEFIPPPLRPRVVNLNAARPVEIIFADILAVLKDRFELFNSSCLING